MAQLASIYAPWDGNAEALASDIEELGVTVRQWRNRGSIPPRYWAKIIDAAKKRGCDLTLAMFVPGESADGDHVADAKPADVAAQPDKSTSIIGAAA